MRSIGAFVGRFALLLLLGATQAVFGQQETDDRVPRVRIGEFLLGTAGDSMSLQRTSRFLAVDRVNKLLQVALVVDATESAEGELQSLRENLKSLILTLADVDAEPIPNVAVAVVVYRSAVSDAGAVQVLIDHFESDLGQVTATVDDLRTESEGPVFPYPSCKAIDQGLYSALTKLDWSNESGVSRWVILAGDAPPYPERSVKFTDCRRHTNSELISEALQRDIAVYGIASGGEEDSTGDHRSKDENRAALREFLAQMSSATGGHTVDLADANSIRFWMSHRLPMDPITLADVERLRNPGETRPLRIAVLPHLPFDRMQFDPDRGATLVATHLRERFARLPGVEVVPVIDVQQAIGALGSTIANNSTTEILGSLTENLSDRLSVTWGEDKEVVDYLVWGRQSEHFDQMIFQSGLYRAHNGERLAWVTHSTKLAADVGRWTILNQIFREICLETATALGDMEREHAEVFLQVAPEQASRRDQIVTLARGPRAHAALLRGVERLDQSLAFTMDEAQGKTLLVDAVASLEQVVDLEPDNAYAHLLLANCQHNLIGYKTDAQDRCNWHLDRAHEALDYLPSSSNVVRLEILAQYSLLRLKDIETAVRLYEELVGQAGTLPARADLRAHWMLAGIHLGEWDAISYGWNQVDPARARRHILAILAFWPHSPEARFYGICLNQDSVDVGNSPLLAGP